MLFFDFLIPTEITVCPRAFFRQYLLIHLELPVTQVDFRSLIGLLIRSAIHVLDPGHLKRARSLDVLVRRKTEVIPSSSRTLSIAAFFPTFATILVAWSITAWIGWHRDSLIPNVSPP
ncbi:hypothetical protein AYI70_g1967 [Smittium culicis]|uniref:Uncharacterized protein n=1 Tax=Smittium culicis TaxID=133412 RepID=A0A1R1YB29_9FUNG|nr:hypothetical protein AYI70_g1967 [Smittium culicis]